jgi:hypothetical protein
MVIESAENEIPDETTLTGSEPDLIEGYKNFHIVIGSFEQEENAYSFASSRESSNEKLMVVEYNGWYRVSHSTYFGNMEAEIGLDNLRNSLNILAWIAYMK